MKKKNKVISFVAAGALSFSLVGGKSVDVFATPNTPNVPNEESRENLDPETKQKADEIMNNLSERLAELGVTFPEVKEIYELYEGIDEDKKEKAKEILEKVKSGEITSEEAKEQLKELGVTLPEKSESDLDEQTKEEVESLIEDAKVQLQEIGADEYYEILNYISQ